MQPRRALPTVTTVGTTYLLAFFFSEGSVGLKRRGGLMELAEDLATAFGDLMVLLMEE